MLWDSVTGRRLQTLEKHVEWITAVAFSSDGQFVASSGLDHSIFVWNPADGQVIDTLSFDTGFPSCVAFSPDSRRLAVGSGVPSSQPLDLPRIVQIYEVPGGRELLTYKGHSSGVLGLAFSPNGKTVASVGGAWRTRTGEAKLWEAATGRDIHTLVGHTDIITNVAFSPDGTRLATSSYDMTAKVWDVATGRLLHTLSGHSQPLECLAFSRDGTRLATGSLDTVVKLWDVATGDEILTLRGHSAGVVSLCFSPDGQKLVSGSIDWTARIWDATPLDAPSGSDREGYGESRRLDSAMLRASSQLLREKGCISFVDVLMHIGKLTKEAHESWRMRRYRIWNERSDSISASSATCRVPSGKMLLRCGFNRGRRLTYSGGRDQNNRYRFSKSGHPRIQEAYATHFVKRRQSVNDKPFGPDLHQASPNSPNQDMLKPDCAAHLGSS